MKNYFQQGDVLLFPETITDGLVDLKTDTLALGESTGHSHRVVGNGFTVFEEPKTKVKYLRLVEPIALRHEEHREITIPPGDYRIGIVREADHFVGVIRQVAD